MERAMLEYLANALWQLPVLAAGAWQPALVGEAGPRTQYRVWLTVLGIGVVLPALGNMQRKGLLRHPLRRPSGPLQASIHWRQRGCSEIGWSGCGGHDWAT